MVDHDVWLARCPFFEQRSQEGRPVDAMELGDVFSHDVHELTNILLDDFLLLLVTIGVTHDSKVVTESI